MVKLSIIVPVYKTEQYLTRCVESILGQTFSDIELILIDDGSPDRCGEICDTFAKKDSRVKVIHKNNAGVAAARNDGLRIANGKYVTVVDSDDYLDQNMYQNILEIAQKYDSDVVMCDCIKEYGDHTEIYTHNIREGYYNREQIEKEYFPNLLIMPNVEYPPTISNWVCVFKNNKKPLHYVEGVRYSEDLLFGAEMMYHADSFYYMKGQALYHYNCTNMGSATQVFKKDKWNDYKKLYRNIENKFNGCKEFDFSDQIQKVLLFFVYNAVGDLMSANSLEKKDKIYYIKNILNDEIVRRMFKNMKVRKLLISNKQKIVTLCYKYNIGISILCEWFK